MTMLLAGSIPLSGSSAQEVDDARAGVTRVVRVAVEWDVGAVPRDSQPASPVSLPREMAVRSLYGLGGWLAGATAGYFVGYALADKSDGGEDPGIDSAVLGAGIGGIVGATLLATAPRRVANCGFARRLAFAVIGAGVGAGFGQLVYSRDGYILPFSGVGAGVAGALACGR